MSPRLRRAAAISSGIGIGVSLLFLAQHPAQAQGMVRPEGPGDFHFMTNIGSFKILGSEGQPVTGHLVFSAKGTILISGFTTLPKTTGTLKLEYKYEPLKKYCYHGEGTITIDGPFRSIQWFGTKLKGDFHGRAKFRLVGEFDKDLNTGFYWTDDANKKQFWPANSVVEYPVPGYTSAITKPPKAIQIPTPSSKSGK